MSRRAAEYGILTLVTDMTEKLRRLDPGTVNNMNHPACFIQDMRWIVDMTTAIKHWCKEEISFQRILGRCKPGIEFELYPTVQELHQFAFELLGSSVHLLSSHNCLGINRALMLIRVLQQSQDGVQVEKLLSIPDNSTSAMLSTLQQHRHIIQSNSLKKKSHHSGEEKNDKTSEGIFLSLDSWVIEGLWLDLAEWRSQQALFVCECLKGIINNVDDDEKPMVRWVLRVSTLLNLTKCTIESAGMVPIAAAGLLMSKP